MDSDAEDSNATAGVAEAFTQLVLAGGAAFFAMHE